MNLPLRAITVRQPWAWAIIHGGKDVENRTRNIAGAYRGPVAIHAASADATDAPDSLWMKHATFYRRSLDLGPDDIWSVRGAVIGVVDLVDVHEDTKCWDRDLRRLADLYRTAPGDVRALPDNGAGGLIGRVRHCSEWAMGDHHHLVFANPRPLAQPIPAKGRLGLWIPGGALQDAIWEQVDA